MFCIKKYQRLIGDKESRFGKEYILRDATEVHIGIDGTMSMRGYSAQTSLDMKFNQILYLQLQTSVITEYFWKHNDNRKCEIITFDMGNSRKLEEIVKGEYSLLSAIKAKQKQKMEIKPG